MKPLGVSCCCAEKLFGKMSITVWAPLRQNVEPDEVLEILLNAQKGAFVKEDGEQWVDKAGKRLK